VKTLSNYANHVNDPKVDDARSPHTRGVQKLEDRRISTFSTPSRFCSNIAILVLLAPPIIKVPKDVVRMAETPALLNERLVSHAHEEATDRGQTNIRCRATKVHK
jgi:hypothetical protein